VLVAVIIGGSLLGIMGTIIAVPAAACLKIFFEEVVLPHIRGEIRRRDEEAARLELQAVDRVAADTQGGAGNESAAVKTTRPKA
jgi:hypothetical protein